MIKEARGYGLTIDEAKENAINILNAKEDADIQFEVIATPKKKTLGLFGGRKAEVRVYVELPDEKPKKENKSNLKQKSQNTPKKETENKQPAKAKVDNKPPKDTVKTENTSKQKPAIDFGEPVDADKIDPNSQAGRAVTYIKAILNNLGCKDITVKVAAKDSAALIVLDGEGLGVVIGRRGETLDSLQYLAGLAANNGGGYYKVTLNIGNYREKREETLVSLAKRVSAQVLNTGKNRTLEPMNPYERRIIHTTVQEIEGVSSISVGEGSGRRVVILVEGSTVRPQRQHNNVRRGPSSPSKKPQTTQPIPKREPKKDSDMPLYGKINKNN